MKLRTKIFGIFTVFLLVILVTVLLGLPYILDSVSTKLMMKEAQDITLFLQNRIISMSSTDPFFENEDFENAVLEDIEIAKKVATTGKSFDISKILFLDPNFNVQMGFPVDEKGKNYLEHSDIRDAFDNKKMAVAFEESENEKGTKKTEVDVVSYFVLKNGSPHVIEVKLDYASSVAMLENQYGIIEITAVVLSILFSFSVLGILLYTINHTVISPVLSVSSAMSKVGDGNLDISLPDKSKDEFGLLARRFNEMVIGLKERFHLTKYVSKGTIDAVRDSVISGDSHVASKVKTALFFSDIRGFTSYSESRDPEKVVGVLNSVLSKQTEIIRSNGGDIDKFVGDEVMAVFDDSLSAVKAACEIQNELGKIRDSIGGLHIGIGIHEGTVVKGDVGSDDMKDFTVIGDAVNTAARLQAVAGPDEIILSEIVAENPQISGNFNIKLRGILKLKGKEKTIRAFIVER